MLPSSLEVLEYLDTSGRSPFGDWFDGLNAEAAAKISVAVTRLRQGNVSSVKSVGDGVMEYKLILVRAIAFISVGTVSESSCCWPVVRNAARARTFAWLERDGQITSGGGHNGNAPDPRF